MSFNISLSGLNAAQKDLDVTGNNIANASSIGFKKSRAEFADVFSNSVFANTKTQVGSGVNTAAVSQQFAQGALQSTSNSLDLAIKGDGFFVLSPSSSSLERSYTRAGAFRVNDLGYVTNALGDYLQAYSVDAQSGSPQTVSINSTIPLQIPTEAGRPTATDTINETLNLPASTVTSPALDPTKFDPSLAATYNNSTSVVVYDSLGQTHTLTQYFVKDLTAANSPPLPSDPTNVWRVFNYMDNKPVDIVGGDVVGPAGTPRATTLVFDSTGALNTATTHSSGFNTTSAPVQTEPLGTAAAGTVVGTPDSAGILTSNVDMTQTLTFNFNNVTQYASSFQVSSLSQNGSTVGQLTNVSIGDDGVVAATYSNGTTNKLGMVALAKFSNPQALTQIGDTSWKESQDSGEAVPGVPGNGTFGNINSSALESSNTDLSAELVNLIAAQRNYQANSRALEVNSQLQDNILQIR
nr:flagellar hook protein FlgE [uncultured Tolumonas sp.]